MRIIQGFKLIGMSALLFAGVLFASAPVLAQDGPNLGVEYAGYSGLGGTDIRLTIARIIRVAMSLLGIVAVVIVLIGGFTWMTAGGNEEKVAEAKKWIFAGVIGLAIILSAFALTSFVIVQLINATTAAGGSGVTL